MSKKNNKNRKKQYVERLKEMETDRERKAKLNQIKKETNRMANDLVDKIDLIDINTEAENKMDVENKHFSMLKKRRTVYRRKKKTRYN